MHTRYVIASALLSAVAAGCAHKAAPPLVVAAPPASFTSQIDANPNMTPEQKAQAKQQVEQIKNTEKSSKTGQ